MNHVLWHDALAHAIPRNTDLYRHIEKYRFDVAIVKLAETDVGPALPGREAGGINVSDRSTGFEPLDDEIAYGTKDDAMNSLIGGIVGDPTPELI